MRRCEDPEYKSIVREIFEVSHRVSRSGRLDELMIWHISDRSAVASQTMRFAAEGRSGATISCSPLRLACRQGKHEHIFGKHKHVLEPMRPSPLMSRLP
jgi:hypothetical protein